MTNYHSEGSPAPGEDSEPSEETLEQAATILREEHLEQLRELLCLSPEMSPERQQRRVAAAAAAYAAMEPRLGSDGMLAMQMLGLNEAIHQCLHRLGRADQSVECSDQLVKFLGKLSDSFVRTVAMRDQHLDRNERSWNEEYMAEIGQEAASRVLAADPPTEAARLSSPETQKSRVQSPRRSSYPREPITAEDRARHERRAAKRHLRKAS